MSPTKSLQPTTSKIFSCEDGVRFMVSTFDRILSPKDYKRLRGYDSTVFHIFLVKIDDKDMTKIYDTRSKIVVINQTSLYCGEVHAKVPVSTRELKSLLKNAMYQLPAWRSKAIEQMMEETVAYVVSEAEAMWPNEEGASKG